MNIQTRTALRNRITELNQRIAAAKTESEKTGADRLAKHILRLLELQKTRVYEPPTSVDV